MAAQVAGTVIADTARQGRDMLRQRGLTITAIDAVTASSRSGGGSGRLRSQAEVVSFIRELATLLATGIPLLSALKTLTDQHHRRFKAVIQQLTDNVAAGASLAEAMDLHGSYFDELAVSIVRVGENTGSLDVALRQLAEFKEKAHRLRSRVLTALMYPLVVLAVGVAVTMFLMTGVVPKLLDALAQSGRELPAITRAVKGCSDFLLGWWWAIFAAAGLAALLLAAVLRTEKGKYIADRLVLSVPLVGELIRKDATSRMAVVLAALLHSNLQFVEAVAVTRRTIRNRVFRRALADYQQLVAAGKDVAAPLAAGGVFSPMVIQMLAVGQETGQMEQMLQQLSEAYDHQIDTATSRLTAVLEPILIVILAVLIGLVAFATILPILESSNV